MGAYLSHYLAQAVVWASLSGVSDFIGRSGRLTCDIIQYLPARLNKQPERIKAALKLAANLKIGGTRFSNRL